MNMNLGISANVRVIVRCNVCKSDPHTEWCPVPRLERLHELNRHIECPICNEQGIGINILDFYECRLCHAQFTSGTGANLNEKAAIFILEDLKTGGLKTVVRLPNKGNGDFPLDKAIEKVQKEIKHLTAKKRKRGMKKRKK